MYEAQYLYVCSSNTIYSHCVHVERSIITRIRDDVVMDVVDDDARPISLHLYQEASGVRKDDRPTRAGDKGSVLT